MFCLLCPAQETPSQMREKIVQSLQGKVVEILDDPSGLPWINFFSQAAHWQLMNTEVCDHGFNISVVCHFIWLEASLLRWMKRSQMIQPFLCMRHAVSVHTKGSTNFANDMHQCQD